MELKRLEMLNKIEIIRKSFLEKERIRLKEQERKDRIDFDIPCWCDGMSDDEIESILDKEISNRGKY